MFSVECLGGPKVQLLFHLLVPVPSGAVSTFCLLLFEILRAKVKVAPKPTANAEPRIIFKINML